MIESNLASKKWRLCLTILLAAGACFYYGITLYGGAGVFVLPLCALLAGVYLVLPGRLLLRILPQKAYPVEMRGPLSLALGAGFLVACYLVAVRLWMPLLFIVPLPVIAVSALWELRPAVKQKTNPLSLQGISAVPFQAFVLGGLLGLLLILYAFAGPVMNALPSAVGTNAIHQDILWNVGNAAALKKNFPPWDLRFMGIPLQYHFFTDLLVAVFSILTGASCYEVAVFGIQPLLLAAMLYTVYRFGQYFYRGNKHSANALLAFVLLAGSASLFFKTSIGHDLFSNNFAEHILTNINAQTTAVLLSALFFALFTHGLRQEFTGGIWQILLPVYAFLLLSIAKGPVALVTLCGIIAGLLLYLINGTASPHNL